MTANWELIYGGKSYIVRNKNYNISTEDGFSLKIQVDGSDFVTLSQANDWTYNDITITPTFNNFDYYDYINVIHTVHNNGSRSHAINVIISSDIRINGKEIFNQHNIDGNKGVEFQSDPFVNFILKNSRDVRDVSTYSYQGCPGFGPLNNCDDWSDQNTSAKIYFSWQNIEIQPDEDQIFKYSIGTGVYFKRKVQITTPIESRYDTSSLLYFRYSIGSIRSGESFTLTKEFLAKSSVTLTDSGGTKTFNENISLPSTPGQYTIKYSITDSLGTEITEIPILVDNIPTIQMKSTIDKRYLQNELITITVEITDDTKARLFIKFGNDQKSFLYSSGTMTYYTSISFSDSGWKNISIYAVDEFGIKSKYLIYRTLINNDPSITSVSGINSYYGPNSNISFTVKVKDDTKCKIIIDDEEENAVFQTDDIEFNGQVKSIPIEFNLTNFSIGNRRISVYAVDEFEFKSVVQTFPFTIIVPSIKIVSVADYYYKSKSNIQFVVNISCYKTCNFTVYSESNSKLYSQNITCNGEEKTIPVEFEANFDSGGPKQLLLSVVDEFGSENNTYLTIYIIPKVHHPQCSQSCNLYNHHHIFRR